jgi:N-methylhydantoinase A
MADLIRKSTIEQGHDPRECVLVAYGGAGPTHAVFYGHDIGSKAILVLADSTAFSAEGMLTCDVTHTEQSSRLLTTPLAPADLAAMTADFEQLERRVLDQFEREGASAADVTLARWLSVRYRLQVHSLEVEVADGPLDGGAGELLEQRFEERYRQLYGEGALLSGGGLEFERHRVVGRRVLEPIAFREHPKGERDADAARRGERSAYFEPDGFRSTPVYDGALLQAGQVISGPAIIERMGDAVVVPPDYQADVDRYLTLRLRSSDQLTSEAATLTSTTESAR